MTSVDSGWITDERPQPDEGPVGRGGVSCPLDLVEGAARVQTPWCVVAGDDVFGVFVRGGLSSEVCRAHAHYVTRMTIDISGRRIFLASPGDLAPDREIVRSGVDAFNQGNMEASGVVFIPLGWEETPVGVGRPQELINEDLDRSDFLFLMLGTRWGSTPGHPEGKYSSGTMEEFYRAVELLADASTDMRDIAVLFRTPPQGQLEDPGDQLKMVLNFRNMLEERKSIFFGTYDTADELRILVERSLKRWQTEKFAAKVAKAISIAEPETIEAPVLPEGSPGDLLPLAEEKFRDGLTSQAEQLYARASAEGDATALTAFARFMRRTGRFARAAEISRELLSTLDAASESAESLTARVTTLVNLGIIFRQSGDLNESLRSLEEAKLTVQRSKIPNPALLAYVFDNIALTWDRLGDTAKTAEYYARSREARSAVEDPVGEVLSAVAQASMLTRDRQFDEAVVEFDRALRLIPKHESVESRRAEARALAGKGKALLRLGRHEDARAPLQQALEQNEELGDATGVAIVRGLLAEAALEVGSLDEVDRLALLILEDSQRSGNRTGEATAYWRLAQAAGARGHDRLAKRYLSDAEQAASAASNLGLLGAIQSTSRSIDRPTTQTEPK